MFTFVELGLSFFAQHDIRTNYSDIDHDSYCQLIVYLMNQVYQHKDLITHRLSYHCLTINPISLNVSGKLRAAWLKNSPNLATEMAQLVIKITQYTSIRTISIKGIKFPKKEIEFFKFWYDEPFGKMIMDQDDEIAVIRNCNSV